MKANKIIDNLRFMANELKREHDETPKHETIVRIRTLEGAINELEKDDWIPVDERLPGTERVLITDGEIVKEGYRRSDGVWKYGIEHEKIFSKLSITGVIAWQPLPEPYKTNK